LNAQRCAQLNQIGYGALGRLFVRRIDQGNRPRAEFLPELQSAAMCWHTTILPFSSQIFQGFRNFIGTES